MASLFAALFAAAGCATATSQSAEPERAGSSAEARPGGSKSTVPRSRLPGRGATAERVPGQAELESALRAAQAGDLEAAMTKSRAAIDKNPRLEQAYLLLGSSCALEGNDACEAEAYGQGLEVLPGSAALEREMGFFLLRQGRVAEGVARLESAQKKQPSPALLADLAVGYKMAGDLDKARATASAAVTQDPSCLGCHMARGEIALAEKRFDAAEAAFKAAADLDPGNVEARRAQAKAVFLAGDLTRAADLFVDLARRAPDDLRVRVQTAQVLLKAQRAKDAVAHLEAAAQMMPDEPKLLALLADAQAQAGEAAAAERTRERAAALEAR